MTTRVPSDIKMLREERVIEVTWRDQSPRRFPAKQLRCACACATCVDEMTGAQRLDTNHIPDDIGITNVELVGNYAIKFAFSDGHDTGIFTWDRLDGLPHVS